MYGVGANALLGGSGKQVAMQPLSVQGQDGLDVAAGVELLTLVAARAVPAFTFSALRTAARRRGALNRWNRRPAA